jgi:hypothetical protein
MTNIVEQFEKQLDSFNPAERKYALSSLLGLVESGNVVLPAERQEVNLHLHTFYSYNANGYSPAKIAWLARKAGLGVAGIIDFDVLDGLEEFFRAASILNLKACAGFETRVFLPEFGDKVINSPGEPGIAYHMGIGMPDAEPKGGFNEFRSNLQESVRKRNCELMARVNKYLSPLELDYEKDVCPLTPAGNATERHICMAYARKARLLFRNDKDLAGFWSEKLGVDPVKLDLPEGIFLLNQIRAKTMKQGGVGYVRPDAGSFPVMAETNCFIKSAGGIPVFAWLDGTSEAEKEIEHLLEIVIDSGVAAINIIPARNYVSGKGKKDLKCRNLYRIVELAQEKCLPVIVGTEMNSPGQKFVDDFKSAELLPLLPVFLKGAYIIYAHSVLQRQSGLGYVSSWAETSFKSKEDKNSFFEKSGRLLCSVREKLLKNLPVDIAPGQVLELIKKIA